MTTEVTREKMRQADHDLLIKLDVKVTDIGVDIKELKDGLNARVAAIEAAVKELKDNQIKLIERVKGLEDRGNIFLWLISPIYVGIIGYAVSRFVALFN